jgi:hypothetical protein
MKNWNLHSNLSNPKKNYQKDKCSIQGGFTKDGKSNVTIQTTPKKVSLWIFFLLMELEIKPISFYHHTMKYHNTQDKKIK